MRLIELLVRMAKVGEFFFQEELLFNPGKLLGKITFCVRKTPFVIGNYFQKLISVPIKIAFHSPTSMHYAKGS